MADREAFLLWLMSAVAKYQDAFCKSPFHRAVRKIAPTATNSVKLFFKKSFGLLSASLKFYKAQLKHNILFEKFKGYVTFLLYVLFVCQSAVSIIKSVTWVDDCCKHFFCVAQSAWLAGYETPESVNVQIKIFLNCCLRFCCSSCFVLLSRCFCHTAFAHKGKTFIQRKLSDTCNTLQEKRWH